MTGVKDTVLFTAIHDFLMVYLPNQQRCSPHTTRAYRYALGTLLDFVTKRRNIPLSKVTFEMLDRKTIIAFLDDIEKNRGCSIATRNGRLNAIRSFFHYAANTEPAAMIYRVEVDSIVVKKEDKPSIVAHLSEPAMKALLEQPNVSTKKGLRDQFLMILLYDTGTRIQELLNIRLQDLHLGKTATVTLCGKGSKTRSVPLMEKTVEHLHQYLKAFHREENLRTDKPLFYVIRDGIPRAMCTDNTRRIIRDYSQKAKLVCPDIPDIVHPHMFRHSRAMHLYQHGMDLTLVSQWLGHAQFETTLIYARADTEQKRQAIQRATPKSSPLNTHFNANRYTITDEDTLRRLCGLT
jgi:site-specific recombinase XerD